MTSSVFVMTTDHGTHSPDTWADMMGQLMFPISPDIAQHNLLAAKKVQLAISSAIAEHAEKIIDHECEMLSSDPDARFDAEHDGHLFVDEAVASIFDAVAGTKWEAEMHEKEDALRAELANHFHHIQSVERMYHSDHNPCDSGDAYKARIHGTGV